MKRETKAPCKSLPLISLVLPVYNHGNYLEEAIESALQAAAPCPLELILVNDGSTDKTPQVMGQYRATPGIRILHQENQGLAMALNHGFALASGDFLTWSSADNLYEQNSLGKLASYLMEHPGTGFVYADVRLIDENGRAFRHSNYRVPDHSRSDSSVLNLPSNSETLFEINDNFINACFLYRREFYELVGQYQSSMIGYEDYDYWLRIGLITRLEKFDSEKPLYQYRLHSNSLTSELDPKKLRETQLDMVRLNDFKNSLLSSTLNFVFSRELNALEKTISDIGSSARIEGDFFSRTGYQEPSSHPATCLIALDNPTSPGLVAKIRLHQQPPKETPQRELFANPELGIFSAEIQDLDHRECSPTRAMLSFGPLEIPASFKRSRDANWQAIVPEPDSRGVILSIPTEDTARFFQKSPLPNWTVCFYCDTTQCRKLADESYLGLQCPRNLRIIDQTDNPLRDPRLARESLNFSPLTYALGSSDCILSPLPPAPSLSNILHLYLQAGFAAAAGIPFIVALESLPPPTWRGLSHQLTDDVLICNYLLRRLGLAPHVYFLEQVIAEHLSGYLEDIFQERLSTEALDSWLLEQSSQVAVKKIASLLL